MAAGRGDERDGVRGGRRPGHVQPTPGECPLGQVDVGVPQAGHDPPTVQRHLRDVVGERGSDGGDPTVAQQDVDGSVAVHQAGIAQQDVAGGRYGPHVSTVDVGYDPTFLGPPVPLPVPAQTGRELPSTHFTVLLDP